MAFNTTINTSLLTTYLIRKFIPALEAELQHQRFTTKAIIPPGEGKIGRFNVFSNPPGTTAALTEGSTTGNEITTLTTTGTDCTIAEYGEFIKLTQLQELAAVKGTRDELSNRMAYGGALALDSLVRTAALTTTSAFYAGSGTSGGSTVAATPTAASATAIIKAAKVLINNSARGLRGVEGHPDGHFAAVVTPTAEADIVTEGTAGRITWQNAVVNVAGPLGQTKFVNGYVGSIYGTAVYRTQNFTQTTVTSLSDNNIIYGEGGVGAVAFKDMKANVIINDVNSPYKNVNSVAWHSFFGTSLIDSLRVVRLYSLA